MTVVSTRCYLLERTGNRDSLFLCKCFAVIHTFSAYYRFRRCVEIDLAKCSVEGGLIFLDSTKPSVALDFAASPTAMMWHPALEGDVEDK